jgi:hypothetical protein
MGQNKANKSKGNEARQAQNTKEFKQNETGKGSINFPKL